MLIQSSHELYELPKGSEEYKRKQLTDIDEDQMKLIIEKDRQMVNYQGIHPKQFRTHQIQLGNTLKFFSSQPQEKVLLLACNIWLCGQWLVTEDDYIYQALNYVSHYF